MNVTDPRVIFWGQGLDEEHGEPTFSAEVVSALEAHRATLTPMDRLILADSYFRLGRVSDAKEQSETGIAADSKLDNATTHTNLARQLLKAGLKQDALRHFQRAYELDPQNVTYRTDYESMHNSAQQR